MPGYLPHYRNTWVPASLPKYLPYPPHYRNTWVPASLPECAPSGVYFDHGKAISQLAARQSGATAAADGTLLVTR